MLLKAVRKEWLLKIGATLLLASGGLVICILAFSKSAFFVLIGLGMLIIGLRFFFREWPNKNILQSRLFRLLLNHPQQIVWVYSVHTQRMPFGFQILESGILYFKLVDGDELSVGLPANQLKKVSESLNPLLPHATFGYTRDREQWYIANPEMLFRDDKDGKDMDLF